MTCVAISQPMFLPWVGIFQQIALTEVFVHFDDVQFPRGRSFCSRVQVKTSNGARWLTVPIRREGLQLIRDVKMDMSQDWKTRHLRLLRESYRAAPHSQMALELVEDIYEYEGDLLCEFCVNGVETIATFLGLESSFKKSSEYGVLGTSSEKLLSITLEEGGTRYLTGHGARNYLDHRLFEDHNVSVEYIDYPLEQYQQLHGAFDPYVSIIDTVANLGQKTRELLSAPSVTWRSFLA